MVANIIQELKWRGAINQQTDEVGLEKLVSEKKIALYCGVDPTGDSMHIGHLLPFMMMKRFELMGHHPYILIGGGTGSIGDPSGRKTERQLQTMAQVQKNVDALSAQAKRLFESENITMVNNYDWLSEISLLDFLRDYGKVFNINTMLAKDIVSSRLETGISFTEFTYQILQSIDYYQLNQKYQIQLQVGGGDQWGNITAGIDMIHKVAGNETEVYGLTIPLLLKADGTKFGKTAGGAVWLDAEKTSPYEFYQFWLNQDDRDVIKYMKLFTFMTESEIMSYQEKLDNAPEKREAQRKLAADVTTFVHGSEGLKAAEKITEVLFSGDLKALSVKEAQQAFNGVPTSEIENQTYNVVDLLLATGVDSSKRQAREDVNNGAITINGEKITDVTTDIDPKNAYDGQFIIIRRGKKKYFMAKVK